MASRYTSLPVQVLEAVKEQLTLNSVVKGERHKSKESQHVALLNGTPGRVTVRTFDGVQSHDLHVRVPDCDVFMSGVGASLRRKGVEVTRR